MPSKDIYIQSDEQHQKTENKVDLNKCSGLIFLSPCTRNIRLFERSKIGHMHPECRFLSDQCTLNRELKIINPDLYEILDPIKYPNGARYFNMDFPREKAFLVHNNYIVGTQNKIARFKKYGLWYK